MKRNILFGSVLAAALSVGLGAQAPTGAPQDPAAPPSSPRPAPSAQAPSAKDDSSSKSVTVTGCLQADSASATGTSGTAPAGGGAAGGGAASSSKSESFILANASTGSGASGAAGAAGTTGSAASSSASQYKLMGGSKSDLTKYVNSKVEIKGKLDSAGGAMSSPSSSSSSGPTLHVDSVKQISPSCTQ